MVFQRTFDLSSHKPFNINEHKTSLSIIWRKSPILILRQFHSANYNSYNRGKNCNEYFSRRRHLVPSFLHTVDLFLLINIFRIYSNVILTTHVLNLKSLAGTWIEYINSNEYTSVYLLLNLLLEGTLVKI